MLKPETGTRAKVAAGAHAGETGTLLSRTIEDGMERTVIRLDDGTEVTTSSPVREQAAAARPTSPFLPPERGTTR